MKALLRENLFELFVLLIIGFSLLRLQGIESSLGRLSQVVSDIELSVEEEDVVMGDTEPLIFLKGIYCAPQRDSNYKMTVDSKMSVTVKRYLRSNGKLSEVLTSQLQRKNDGYFVTFNEADGSQSTYLIRNIQRDNQGVVESYSIDVFDFRINGCQ